MFQNRRSGENQNSELPFITSIQERINQRKQELQQSNLPLPLALWWETKELFQGQKLPPALIAKAKFELLLREWQDNSQEYREFPPTLFYTVRQEFLAEDEEKMKKVVTDATLTTQEELGFPFRYSGFFTPSNTDKEKKHYNFTFYSRTREPLITYDHCKKAAGHFIKKLTEAGIMPSVSELTGTWYEPRIDELKDKDCRIILGREEGYNTQRAEGENAKIYTFQEVQNLLGNIDNINLREAKIFSVKQDATGKAEYYEEDAVEVVCPFEDLSRIYTVAHKMRQARFNVEAYRKGFSYPVEIKKFCKDPDPQPTIEQWLTPRYRHFRQIAT